MNQNLEQLARDTIDRLLSAADWQVYFKRKMNLTAITGIAVREYQTNIALSNYVFTIETKNTKEGGIATMGEKVDKWKRLNQPPLLYEVEFVMTKIYT